MLLTLCAAAAPLLQAAELTGSLDGPLPSGDVLVEAIDTSLRVVGEVLVADDGDFHLEGLPALPVRLRVSPVDEQGLPDRYYPDGDGWCEGALVSLARGQVANGHRISLVTGAQLTGRLLGPDGTPAAGAAVIATPVDDGPMLSLVMKPSTFANPSPTEHDARKDLSKEDPLMAPPSASNPSVRPMVVATQTPTGFADWRALSARRTPS